MYVIRKYRGSPGRGVWVYFQCFDDDVPVWSTTIKAATKYHKEKDAEKISEKTGGSVHKPWQRYELGGAN